MSKVKRGTGAIVWVSIGGSSITIRQGRHIRTLMGEGRMIAFALDQIFPGRTPVTDKRVGYRRSGDMLLSLHSPLGGGSS